MRGKKEILAAGAVVWKGVGDERLITVIHRPRYDDWSLPKGKLDPGECLPQAAVREVAEETGIDVCLGLPLDRQEYPTNKGVKQVSYWEARVLRERERKPDREVDRVEWMSFEDAFNTLTHGNDRRLLTQFMAQPTTSTLLVVRHAKAMERVNWSGRDAARPLTAVGRQQSADIIALLAAYDTARLVSSSSNRCVSTLLPYATSRGLTIERVSQLSEEEGADDADGVHALISDLREEVVRTGVNTAVSGHRPVLPHMLRALDIPDRSLRKGEVMPIHLDADGEVVAVERHRPQKDRP